MDAVITFNDILISKFDDDLEKVYATLLKCHEFDLKTPLQVLLFLLVSNRQGMILEDLINISDRYKKKLIKSELKVLTDPITVNGAHVITFDYTSPKNIKTSRALVLTPKGRLLKKILDSGEYY